MSFKIRVGQDFFEWKNDELVCSDDATMKELKALLEFHIPNVVVHPGGIDYNSDLTDGPNSYYAILGSFKNCEIIKEPSEDFLFDYFDENAIY